MRRLSVGAVAAITATLAVALVASSFAGAAKVEPEQIPQGQSACSLFEGPGQDWIEFKPQPEPPPSGNYNDGTLFVTITYTSAAVIDWSSNIGVDAVIVKGGPDGGYLYRYDPPQEETSDTGLTLPSGGISHISFCYDVEPTGDLTVIKRVTNDDGGKASSSDWTMNVAGATPLSFPGASDPGTTNEVDAGDYTVTESGGPQGYTLTYSGDCNAQGQVTVPANGSATCILTNDDDEGPPPPEKGTITVEKQTIPDGYVPPQGGFVFGGAIEATLLDGESETVEVDAGTYTVTENLDGRPFWDLISIKCSDDDSSGDLESKTATYEVDPGEDVTCVFTNQKRSLLIVRKQTVPAGATQEFAFTASYSDGFTLSDGEQEATPLPAGSYSVQESPVEGWELDSVTCDNGDDPSDIDLAQDTTVICTFVNRELPETGTIVVEKVTNPAGDGTEFDFDFGDAGFTLSDGESETFDGLEAGTYSVSEDTPEGWDLTSATCDDESDPGQIELSAGETVTCTFTNTKLGSVTIVKETDPEDTQVEFPFTFEESGFSLTGGESATFDNLLPGTYSAAEGTLPDGWTLESATCDDESDPAEIDVSAGEDVVCTFLNTKQVVTTGRGSIRVSKSASPTSIKEPGGPVTYSVTITNTSNVLVTITSVVDDRFGDLENVSGGNPAGCFDVPINLAPGASSNCQFAKTITGTGGTSHVNVVTAKGTDEFGNPVSDSDDARVDITERLIDLVIVKDATSPTPLNGTVSYALTVTNKGPDTATNVQLADPAPVGIMYLTANPSQGTCNLSPALITCALGSIAPGQTVTIAITGRATAVGSHTNTATVTGSGGRETNPADNVDTAVTVVPAPLKPPTAKPEPKPKPEVCLSLTVSPAMIKADGKADKVTTKVTAGSKRVKGAKVSISGAGVKKTGRTNGKGVAVIRINPKKPGIITIAVVETNQKLCGSKRIGVVGVFLPPLTG